MAERVVGVLVAGRAVEVTGPAAELVALVAAADLPPRTLRLLIAIALDQPHLDAMTAGSLTVDIGPRQLRLHWRESRPAVPVGSREVS